MFDIHTMHCVFAPLKHGVMQTLPRKIMEHCRLCQRKFMEPSFFAPLDVEPNMLTKPPLESGNRLVQSDGSGPFFSQKFNTLT